MSEANSPSGVEMIARERIRQIEEEGWSPEHDEQWIDGELSGAGSCYASTASRQIASELGRAEAVKPPCQLWRWDNEWWKPSDTPIRNLVKAGALIAAEIDRLLREASV